ncbi:hypothetical protein BCR39DRAFT_508285 [Naematelia encephala]|uniref:Uncharacterized protein n=1 Tax=Naematelia encephala TaxID=71784 RepID=A0A1Y2AGT2_9TREE|nr:hypothetical protein BCR39DRAFT_508285 [Naematelia encephala]
MGVITVESPDHIIALDQGMGWSGCGARKGVTLILPIQWNMQEVETNNKSGEKEIRQMVMANNLHVYWSWGYDVQFLLDGGLGHKVKSILDAGQHSQVGTSWSTNVTMPLPTGVEGSETALPRFSKGYQL